MSNTKTIRRDKHSVTREVLRDVSTIRSLIADCKAIQSLQVRLGGSNKMLDAKMASKTAEISCVLNGTTKYNVKMGVN